MRLSIITPTLLRPTLARMYMSLQDQKFQDYEHLVMIDLVESKMTDAERARADAISYDVHSHVFYGDGPHHDFGHWGRHMLTRHAQGDYILFLDDDDYLAHDEALTMMMDSVHAAWMTFPVEREGNRFFNPRPARYSTTLSSFIVAREHAAFPSPNGHTGKRLYELDGDFLEGLVTCLGLPQVLETRDPLVIIPQASQGER